MLRKIKRMFLQSQDVESTGNATVGELLTKSSDKSKARSSDPSSAKIYGSDGPIDVINFGEVNENNVADDLYRQLSMEEILELRDNKKVISDFKRDKLEKDAQKNWDIFYKRNSTRFFKDRHWTKREFQELCPDDGEDRSVVLEVGCGVGNFIFPLIEEGCNSFFYACDFSPRAIQFVKDHTCYSSEQICAFQSDVTKDNLADTIPRDSVHIATMIFVLSAISPDKMVQSLKNVFQVLVPGGLLLFRDYGLHDYAMLRFASGHKISENFYFRQDGTRVYYFSTEYLSKIATESGFVVTENEYIHRETVNRKESLSVPRIFVQAKLKKPDLPTAETDFS